MHDYTDAAEGMIRPGTDCNLPPAERDKTQLMQTARCSHGTLFLLVDRFGGSSEWIEAEAWWDECRQMEDNLRAMYAKPDPEYFDYAEGVSGFDFPIFDNDWKDRF